MILFLATTNVVHIELWLEVGGRIFVFDQIIMNSVELFHPLIIIRVDIHIYGAFNNSCFKVSLLVIHLSMAE